MIEYARKIAELERKVEMLSRIEVSTPVYLLAPLTSTSWDGDAYSTTAKTKIDLSDVFGAPAAIRAVYMYWAWLDSASSSSNCYLCLSPNDTDVSGIFLGAYGQANSKRLFGAVWIPCDTSGDIYYQIAASGSGTMNIYLQVWGYLL